MGHAGHAGAPANTAAEMMRGASNRWGEWPDLGMFKIAQTPLARSWHIRPMSMGEWYQHKALQCARLAQDTSDPLGRRRYEEEEKAWRQLAHQIEAHETVQSDPTSGLSERSTVVGRLFLVRGPDG
jgi:hypothetical protein